MKYVNSRYSETRRRNRSLEYNDVESVKASRLSACINKSLSKVCKTE